MTFYHVITKIPHEYKDSNNTKHIQILSGSESVELIFCYEFGWMAVNTIPNLTMERIKIIQRNVLYHKYEAQVSKMYNNLWPIVSNATAATWHVIVHAHPESETRKL